jgi:hypothetical protein
LRRGFRSWRNTSSPRTTTPTSPNGQPGPATPTPTGIAIEYAEKFAVDHLSLDDAWFAKAKQHYTEEQLHGMALMIGAWIAFGRLQTILDVHLSCSLIL